MILKKSKNQSALFSIFISCSITFSLIYFLIRETKADDWFFLIQQLNIPLLLLFIISWIVSMILRAVRYQLLLNASNLQLNVSIYIMILTTFVKNLFVDLLPARIGALSYVVLLNKKFRLPISCCLSSFTLSIVFDLFSMIPLLWFAIFIGLVITDKSDPLWFFPISIMILIISCLVFIYIDRLCFFLGKILAYVEEKKWIVKFIGLEKTGEVLKQTADDLNFIKRKKIFFRLLTISIVIRILKYIGLSILLLSFLPHDGKISLVNVSGWIFFGLIAAEASASLPISGIGGFGAYEWSLISVLSILGFSGSIAAVASFGLHLLTQLIDYSLGGIALMAALLFRLPDTQNKT